MDTRRLPSRFGRECPNTEVPIGSGHTRNFSRQDEVKHLMKPTIQSASLN